MGDSKDPGLVRVQVSIEHAGAVAKLELDTGPFLHLKRGAAEPSDQILRRHARQPRDLALLRRGLRRRFGLRLLGTRGASAKKQGGGEDQAAHAPRMPAPLRRGKVAAARMRG